ncbi:hypothetical protein [Terrihabitans rhizophilus]|uniref:Uncharacterized protein n=1 Tax=Terrihabitans rhizophilus TaxID=3092662 RepID=A0ABU4RQL6_9HYPH|nr:hypothetical protein [Terrihabitans sp. PJ23]MDX6807162.1 hypothetical protein [Terrihabitans sp. PJ23]
MINGFRGNPPALPSMQCSAYGSSSTGSGPPMRWLLWIALQLGIMGAVTYAGIYGDPPQPAALLVGFCLAALATGLLTVWFAHLRYRLFGGPKPLKREVPVPYPRNLAKSVQAQEAERREALGLDRDPEAVGTTRAFPTLPYRIEGEERRR